MRCEMPCDKRTRLSSRICLNVPSLMRTSGGVCGSVAGSIAWGVSGSAMRSDSFCVSTAGASVAGVSAVGLSAAGVVAVGSVSSLSVTGLRRIIGDIKRGMFSP